MKKLNFHLRQLILFTLTALPFLTSAYDFEVDGIYYNIISDTEVAVTYRTYYYNSNSHEYTGDVVIPETVYYNSRNYSVISIGNHALYNSVDLISICIPNSVTSIGDYAFNGCSGLTSVNIPNSVTAIGEGAFQFNYGLTSVSLPNSVTSIGGSAFWDCSRLTSISIPNSVTYIGGGAFHNCNGLTHVMISDIAAWCNISFGNSSANPLYYAHTLYLNGEKIEDIDIPETVTSIGASAFSGCNSLTSITIPNSVTSIGSSAFYGCTGLISLSIGNSVTSIGSGAFGSCNGLTAITIPKSVTTIGNYAFERCTSLKDLTFEDGEETLSLGYNYDTNSVSSQGKGLFYDCPFEKLYLGRNLSYNTSSSCGYSPFYRNTYLRELIIGHTVTSIYSYAFAGCISLKPFELPEGIEIIGEKAFFQCPILNLTLPATIYGIGDYAFGESGRINQIICKRSTPPTISTNTFDDLVKYGTPLYVPASSVEEYKTASTWRDFFNIYSMDEANTGIDDIVFEYDEDVNSNSGSDIDADAEVDIYALNGLLIYTGSFSEVNLPKGLYLVRRGTSVTKIYVE